MNGRTGKTNPYLGWFAATVWLGIAVNLAFALPAVLVPDRLTALLALPRPHPEVWLRDAGLLLFFLTLTYIPAAVDPFRYHINAIVLVWARLLFAVFWFWLVAFAAGPGGYLWLGAIDLIFGLMPGVLLMLVWREDDRAVFGYRA